MNVKALVGTFNQEKALVGAFSVIVQPVVELMDRFTALIVILKPNCSPQLASRGEPLFVRVSIFWRDPEPGFF